MAVVDSALAMSALGTNVPTSPGAGTPLSTAPPLIQVGDGAPTHVAAQGTIYIQRNANAAAGEPTVWIKGSGGQATPTSAGWAGSNAGAVASGTLTNAQVQALFSAPIDAIPAVTGKIIVPSFIALRANYVAGYSLNRNVGLRYVGVATDLVTPVQAIANAPVTDQLLWSSRVQSVNPWASALDLRGLKVQLLNTSGADVTGGDPSNTLSYQIQFDVYDRP